jgi:peptidoglycan hydrolase-like protein with peptidoglycan-binding domain
MAYALATRLERAVKDAGVKYKKVSGWASRGHGSMGSIKTIVAHHTAGPLRGNSPSLNVVAYGRPGLSGPLSQLFLARDGTVYLVAAGLSYHAGRVRSNSYSNSHSIGIEAENTGLSNDPWPAHQIDAYAKLCKALCKEFGLSTSRVLGHREVCSPVGRKSDPSFSMSDFRKKVGGAKGGVSSGGGTSGGSRSYKSVSYGTTLGKWDKGDPVKDWQDFLKAQGYDLGKGGVDGYFGDSTVSATKKYQKKVGVKVDGMAGKDTWAKAKKDGFKWKRKKASKSAPYPLPKGHFYYTEDKRNTVHSGYWKKDRPAIRKIQKKVGTGVDGGYGVKTKAAVMRWQKKHGLKADGAVGPSTWNRMF